MQGAEIAIILLLILLNGFFSLSEMAVVSARKSLLKVRAEGGERGAAAALRLAENPGRFLSTVQIAITLIGVLTGLYSGITLAAPVAEEIIGFGVSPEIAKNTALTFIVITTTVFTLLFGELVPKRLALAFPERIASGIAYPMDFLSRIAVLPVSVLEWATDAVFSLFRLKANEGSKITEEEVRSLISEGAESGVFEHEEKSLIDGVLALSSLPVKAVMTSRQNIIWLDIGESREKVLAKIKSSRHSRYIVCEGGDVENFIGVVAARDILTSAPSGDDFSLTEVVNRTPPAISPNISVLDSLEIFRGSPANVALVVDEYGALEGIITLKDVLMAIAGSFPAHKSNPEPHIRKREDGSFILDGRVRIAEVEKAIGMRDMAGEDDDFVTLAGFVLHKLGEFPSEGQVMEWNGYRFEIMDMDGKRIDKILIAPFSLN